MIRGLHISEERRLAGRLTAWLYLTASMSGLALLALPGVHVVAPWLVEAVAAVGFAWGLAAFFLVPWSTAPPVVSLFSSGLGLALSATVMACTGGASSPARFYLLFVIFYCSYFYVPREAAFFVGATAVVQMLPLTYEHGVVSQGFVAELVVTVPTYVVLAGLVASSKQLQLGLRDRADARALLDPLTGVANRRAFEIALETDARGNERTVDRTGLLLVDLDDFKSANTLFGHTGGDRVLCAAAEALREAARGNDLVARLGGDEFAVLASGSNEVGTARLADRVLSALRKADRGLDLQGFTLSASVGWATHPMPVRSKADLVEHADRALALAKASGKDTGRPAEDLDTTSSRPVAG